MKKLNLQKTAADKAKAEYEKAIKEKDDVAKNLLKTNTK